MSLLDVQCRNFGTSHVTALFLDPKEYHPFPALNQILGGHRLKTHRGGGIDYDTLIRTSVNQDQEFLFHNDALASFVACG